MSEYVVPNTTIWIIKNCPCEPDYKNTLYFGSKAAQLATFANWIKYKLDAHSYQRYGAGRIQVEKSVEDLYDCNYLLFQNTNFKDSSGNAKWFYAFITDVEYVNNNTSTITYEIDVLQTWLKDYELQEVMVLREHPLTDAPGENITPEPFGNLPMVYENAMDITTPDGRRLKDLAIVGWFASNTNCRPAMGLPTMLTWCQYPYTKSGLEQFNTALEDLDPKNLIALHVAPVVLMPDTNRPVEPYDFDAQSKPVSFSFDVPRPLSGPFTQKVNGVATSYTPKNKKLYTAPYMSAYLSTNDGNGKTFRFEFSDLNTVLSFRVIGDFTPNPSVTLVPLSYKGVTENYAEAISFSGYPQCGTDSDAYKAWLAQRGGVLGVQALGGIAMAIAGLVTQQPILAISGATTALGAGAQVAGAAEMPNSGSAGGGSAAGLAAARKLTFTAMLQHVTVEAAKRIDDYFNRYGYAINQVKKPNIGTRPYYNYVQTENCAISGSIPASAERRICEIFDRGVTWWVSVGAFGDYSVDNSPTAAQSGESEAS